MFFKAFLALLLIIRLRRIPTHLSEWILLLTTKFWKPIQYLEANQAPQTFLHQLTVQGAESPHPRPPVAYNWCVSFFSKHMKDRHNNTATDWWYLHMHRTSATGWQSGYVKVVRKTECDIKDHNFKGFITINNISTPFFNWKIAAIHFVSVIDYY